MVLGFAGIFGGNARPAAEATPVSHSQTKAASTFSPVLKAALEPARVSKPAALASQKHALSAKSSSQPVKNASLTLTPGLNVTTPGAPAAGTPDPPPPTAIDALKAALVRAGVDTTNMQFQEHQDVVTYPGGSYVNDLISFQSGDKTHEYMTNLVSIAPQVTVTEIQQLLAGNRG